MQQKKIIKRENPKSLQIAEQGINNTNDLMGFFQSLIADVMSGRITTQRSNAAVYACGKLLRLTELEFRRAESGKSGGAPGSIALKSMPEMEIK